MKNPERNPNVDADGYLVDSISGHMMSAFECMDEKDFNGAINYFCLITSKSKSYPEAYYWRGISFAILRRYDSAVKDFTSTIESDPAYSDVTTIWELRKGFTQAVYSEKRRAKLTDKTDRRFFRDLKKACVTLTAKIQN
jgi:tetratricopeptide (TPR) repeat protein